MLELGIITEIFWTFFGGFVGAILSLIVAGFLQKPKLVLRKNRTYSKWKGESEDKRRVYYLVKVENQERQKPVLRNIRRHPAYNCTAHLNEPGNSEALRMFTKTGWSNQNDFDQVSSPLPVKTLQSGEAEYVPIFVKDEGDENVYLTKLDEDGEVIKGNPVDGKNVSLRIRSASGILLEKEFKPISNGKRAEDFEVSRK